MEKKILTDIEFEDLCSKIENCFFIQIGANDGISVDPINKIILKNNWSGILVEPGFESFNELVKNYQGLKNLFFEMSAISDKDGEVTLYCGSTTPHFTLDFEKAKWMFDVEPKARKVPSLTPKSLIEKYSVQKIDVLQIDAEGHDFIILENFPFESFLPKIIRFEFVNLHNILSQSISFLENKGYKCYFSEDDADIIAILN